MERKVPDKDQMAAYLRRGLTHERIAEVWREQSGNRCARSAISMAIERYGLVSARPRPRYDDFIPWRVKTEHKDHNDLRMLRVAARYARHQPLGRPLRRRLTAWKRTLRDTVIVYDPTTPVGFGREPRLPDDGIRLWRAN